MIRRVLIANRGEIAVRIQRACRELGIETVQAYSQADRDSLPVRMAERSVCIGGPRAADSYLNAAFLLSAAVTSGADAIHPGYGFLSENAEFARACEEADITFVGPSSRCIELMGDKSMAKRMADEAGVPTTPGSRGSLSGAEEALEVSERIGYPVILKASSGGGGRGMRIVRDPSQLAPAFDLASREARAAFGDGAMYVEKYLTGIRHVEIQVVSDGETVLHFGERDCSMQRRNQKLVEESPSPALDAQMRERMGAAAVRLCRHIGYTNAGTIEFIFDEASSSFYFMEMNTRIQVEHPVTEMVTGVDLVKLQLRVASGERLPMAQHEIRFHGHAVECRINAENAERDFAPSPGVVQEFAAPGGPGVRIDTHLFRGYAIPPYYDSLLAKLICWGETREESLSRMKRALTELQVTGVTTTADFHRHLIDDPGFRAGKAHTRYVEEVFLPARASAATAEGDGA